MNNQEPEIICYLDERDFARRGHIIGCIYSMSFEGMEPLIRKREYDALAVRAAELEGERKSIAKQWADALIELGKRVLNGR